MKIKITISTALMAGILFSCGIPNGLGVSEAGRLKNPPSTPNCVSSQALPEDRVHYMEPWSYDNFEYAREKLISCIHDFGDTKIISSETIYIHAVFTTGWMRWKDDVEFYLDREEQLIHFRSASRIGYGDHGVNRKRMKRLKELYLN